MIKIAICEDEQFYMKSACDLLNDYCEVRKIANFALFKFTNSSDFIDKLEKGDTFDIYLLDIYMKGVSGMDIARTLRRMGDKGPIVFLTTSIDHALEAFGVGATQYLVKPYSRDKFYAALDEVLEKVDKLGKTQIVFKTEREYHNISIAEMLYSETNGNYQVVKLKNGENLTVRITATDLFENLEKYKCFGRLGKAFIINLSQVDKLLAKSVIMSDGREIDIPRHSLTEFRTAYFKYYSDEE